MLLYITDETEKPCIEVQKLGNSLATRPVDGRNIDDQLYEK